MRLGPVLGATLRAARPSRRAPAPRTWCGRTCRGNKTDRTDVKGILEAYRNEDIRPVPREDGGAPGAGRAASIRSAWVAERTARLNTIRGLLRELGVFIPVGARKVIPEVWAHLADAESGIPDAVRPFLAEACERCATWSVGSRLVERQLEALAEQTPAIQRLLTVPGIGLLTATALFAFVVDVQRFPSARHLASYLGLTPRERSSGNTRRLGAHHEERRRLPAPLLVHGARSVLARAKQKATARAIACGNGRRRSRRPAAQQGGGCAREQDGPDGVGGLASRRELPAGTRRRLVEEEFPPWAARRSSDG